MNFAPLTGACVPRSSLCLRSHSVGKCVKVFSIPHTWVGRHWSGRSAQDTLLFIRAPSSLPGIGWQSGNSPAGHHWPTPSSLPGISEHQDANPSLQLSSHGAHSRRILYPPLMDSPVQRANHLAICLHAYPHCSWVLVLALISEVEATLRHKNPGRFCGSASPRCRRCVTHVE